MLNKGDLALGKKEISLGFVNVTLSLSLLSNGMPI